MPEAGARSWWAEVEHLREPLERRRREVEHPPAGPVAGESARLPTPGPRIIGPRTDSPQRRGSHADAPAAGVASATLQPRRARFAAEPSERGTQSSDGPPRGGRFRRRAHEEALVQAAHQPPRRTVQIRGQAIPTVAAPRLVEVERRRPARGIAPPKVRSSPDRIALWAFLLGLLLVVVAVLTAHAG